MASANMTASILQQVHKAKVEDTPDFDKEEEILKFVRPSRWVSVDFGRIKIFRFNWVTTAIASAVLWSMTIAALIEPAETLKEWGIWQSWISQNFTWLYIATQNVWAAFLIYLFFSRFGKLKLGKPDEKPEFNDLTWFCMLFTCGIAVGVYYWGVSEPMYYFRAGYSNKLWKTPVNNDDDKAQQAMTMTFFHWGLHGFVVYIVVALAIGVVCYRWNLPVTMRSAFYPLLGDLIYSTLGDIIDALSIACTTFGVCTSLGFGVSSILYGVSRLDNGKTDPNDKDLKQAVIWVITIAATASIIAGLKRGIKNLSVVTFIVGLMLMLAVTFMDNTWYILNVFTQTLGHYFQYIVQLGWDCDAWQQLGYEFGGTEGNRLWGSAGNSLVDKVGVLVDSSKGITQDAFYGSHNKQYMEWWTIFYWGWWISWAPFVGTFMARVSRGRTVKQLIGGAFFAPVLFSFMWLTVFGSLGIKMQRVCEMRLGVKPDWQDGSINCTAMGYSGGQLIASGVNGYRADAHALASEGYYPVACRNHGDRLFDVLSPYEGMKDFFFGLVIVGVSLYFVTSSDSGSYIDDILAAQGLQEPPVLQKIFWACTEGACACGLIAAGGDDALAALQAASISAGLPYTIAICFLCLSLHRALKMDAGDEDICNATDWSSSCFDLFNGFGGYNAQERLVEIAMAIFCPFMGIWTTAKHVYGECSFATFSLVMAVGCFLSWLVLILVSAGGNDNFAYLGWVFFCFLATHVTMLRGEVRAKHNIYGGLASDFVAAFFYFPFTLAQLVHHSNNVVVAPTKVTM